MTDDDVMEVVPAEQPEDEPRATNKPSTLMWIEKYRPDNLDDLLSHKEIIGTLRHLISNNRLPHLLFYGPPGTGKTSTVLACAKMMYGSSYKSMVLELNASDDRGISIVRDQIKSFASTRRMFSTGVKLIVLDEADAMTSAAQMALRRVVEKFSANTRFCIICNFVNKIIPALQSRCTKFRFGPLPNEDVRTRVKQIAEMEDIKLTDSGLSALLTVGKGDMRRILNVMQSSHMASIATRSSTIDGDAVYSNTGAPHPSDIDAIWQSMQADDFVLCVKKLDSLKTEKGLALADIVAELLPYVRESSFSQDAKGMMYEKLADIEDRLAAGGSEKLNSAALIGSCRLAATQALLDLSNTMD